MESSTIIHLIKPIFIFLIFIFILGVITYYLQFNATVQSSSLFFFLILFILIISTGFVVASKFSQSIGMDFIQSANPVWKIMIFVILLVIFFLNSSATFSFFVSVFTSFSALVFIFCVIITMTIVYLILKETNLSIPIDQNLLLQIIFYLPCLIDQLIHYISNDFATTPAIISLLFVIEIVLILSYLYIPKIIAKIATKDRFGILNEAVFLDKQRTIMNSQSFQKNEPISELSIFNGTNPTIVINTTFSLSAWINIASEQKTEETEIFNYASHPRITYKNNTNKTIKQQNMMLVYLSKNAEPVMFPVELQKWNYFVFNYMPSNICNVFCNGELIKSIDMSNHLPEFKLTDVISVGQENGIYGSIANISYYSTPLTPSQIATIYNFLMFKNPPLYN